MDDIVAVINPHSGLNLRDQFRIHKIRKIMQQRKIYTTSSFEDLENVAIEIAQKNPRIVAIDGGDGTISTVIGAIWRHWPAEKPFPQFAFLGGGTFNALPKYAGIYKGISYLKGIVASSSDELVMHDVDMMEIVDDRGIRSLGFSFGMGLPVDLLREFYKKKRLKYLRIAFMSIRLWLSMFFNGRYYRRFNRKMALTIDGKEEKWLNLMAQTIPSFGAPRCKMFYRAALARHKFHILGTQRELKKFILYFMSIYIGRKVPITQFDHQREQMTICSEEDFFYQVNGELEFWGKDYKAHKIDIKHGITLQVVRPSHRKC